MKATFSLQVNILRHDDDVSVCIDVVSGATTVGLPLSAHEARQLASRLLLNAREIDPGGHVELIDAMGREIGQHILLAAYQPEPGTRAN